MENEDEWTFELSLIENIKNRKYLYDKSEPLYFNKKNTQMAWKAIADRCNKSEAYCKHKWRLPRNRFYRELKRIEAPSGSDMCHAPEWRLLMPMLFLKDIDNMPHRPYNVALEMEPPIFSGDSLMKSPISSVMPSKKTTLNNLCTKFGETNENIEERAAPTACAAQKVCEKKQMQPPPMDQRLLLIISMRQKPCLYQSELLGTPTMQQQEKKRMWQIVAEESGFEKPEFARVKWCYLIVYMRMHLLNVAKKQLRRYTPNTDNPDDKYVKLDDWKYFKELEYILPYLNHATKNKSNGNILENCVNSNSNNMDNLMNSVDGKQRKLNENLVSDEQQPLTTEDLILKEFFDNMFKSTLRLPRFHQDRVKTKLIQTIKKQSKD